MQTIDLNFLKELASIRDVPCISLYMTTHRQHPESAVDPIAFKKLYRRTVSYVEENELHDHKPLLKNIETLTEDKNFWDHGDHGLAILCSPTETKIIRLPSAVEEISCVAQSFCIKPLFKFYNENQRYYLLALGLDDVKFYQGDKYHIEEISIEGKVPTDMQETLGEELTDNYRHANVIQGTGMHGYMEKSQEEEIDMDRFFRRVDQAVQEQFAVSKDMPLYVATLPEHQTHYSRIAKGTHVQPISLGANPVTMSKDELLIRMKDILDENFLTYKKSLLERAQLAGPENLSSTELSDVVRDALDGKIEVLFIEQDRSIKGSIDAERREVQESKVLSTDVLNELSCLVIDQGGRVFVVDKEEMRSETGAFTINRY